MLIVSKGIAARPGRGWGLWIEVLTEPFMECTVII
jgi:hypothetical protein